MLITLCVIALLLFYYYAIYIPQKEHAIIEQRFHALKQVDNATRKKLADFESLMRNDLHAVTDTINNFDSVARYIVHRGYDGFSISLQRNKIAASPVMNRSVLKLIDTLEQNVLQFQMDTITAASLEKGNEFYYRNEIIVNLSVESFINPQLNKDILDEYVLLDDHTVAYETFPSGLNYQSRDSLLQISNGAASSNQRELTLAGTHYKLFILPVQFFKGHHWVIAGLLKTANLNAESHHLSGNVIEVLVIVVLLLFFLLPWIKVMLMGKSERIKMEDVAFAYICSMLLVSFIFFFSFKYNLPFRPSSNVIAKEQSDSPATNDSKIFIANTLIKNFHDELSEVYDQLVRFDKLRNEVPEIKNIKSLCDVDSDLHRGLQFGTGEEWKQQTAFDTSLIRNSITYRSFQNAYWLDETGNEIAAWSNENAPPPNNYAHRDYFRKIRKKEFYFLDGNPQKKFFFEPIHSLNDREFKVALSIPSATPGEVAVITFQPRSVINPVMLLGYSYAVINNEGTIVFQNNADENNENLTAEVSAQQTMRAAIESRVSKTFRTQYAGKRNAAYITPLPDLPYHLIIFSELQFKERRNLECFSFTLMMAFAFFGLLCIEVVLVLIGSYQQTRLRKNKFRLSWIFPLESKKKIYGVMIFIYAFTLLLLSGYIFFCKSLSLMLFTFVFFTSAVLLSFISSIVYSKSESLQLIKEIDNLKTGSGWKRIKAAKRIMKETFSNNAARYLALLLFVINVAAYYYLRKDYINCLLTQVCILMVTSVPLLLSEWLFSIVKIKGSVSERIKTAGKIIKQLISHKSAKNLIALVCIINIAAFYYLKKEFIYCLIPQACILLIAAMPLLLRIKTTKYSHLFTLMIWLRLLIICGLPVVVFYINGYNYDQHITTRLRLLDFAQQLKEKSINENCFIDSLKDNESCFAYYNDQSWVKSIKMVDRVTHTKPYSPEESASLNVIHFARINYNKNSRKGDELSHLQSKDGSWFFNSVFADADTCYFKWSDGPSSQYLMLTGDKGLNYQFPVIFQFTDLKQWLFWILLAFVLFTFYKMLHYIIVQLYGLFASNTRGMTDMYREILSDDKLNNLVYINGAPGSDKMVLVKRELQKIGLSLNKNNHDEGPVCVIDMLEMPDSSENKELWIEWEEKIKKAFGPQYVCILFDHFEYNINDQVCNRHKLNAIEKFMLDGKKKLVIVSAIHQAAFLEILDQWQSKSEEEMKQVKEDIPRWNVLLGHFLNLYISLNREIEEKWIKRPEWDISITIWEECRHTNFLRKMHGKMQRYVAQLLEKDPAAIDKEDIILKVQSLAHIFYYYMWTSLTREEQFLLYDLAEDELINTTNKHRIRRLMNKGLIHLKDGRLTLFNQSFRNFILTSISTNDVKAIEAEIRDNGSWKKLRYPALLILAALSYFIFTAEQENLGDAVKYLSALAAAVPLIIKLLGLTMPAEAK